MNRHPEGLHHQQQDEDEGDDHGPDRDDTGQGLRHTLQRPGDLRTGGAHLVGGKYAGLPVECKLHGLRATYATMLEEAGVSDKGQQSVMGHSKLQTTEHYRRGAKGRIASTEAAEKLAHYNPEDHAIRPAVHLRVLDGGKR